MKKILFVVGAFQVGGIQSYFCKLFKRLSQDYEVSVLLLSDKNDETMLNMLKYNSTVYYWRDFVNNEIMFTKYSAFNHSLGLSENKIRDKFSDIDYLHAVDSETLIPAYQVSSLVCATLTLGCYHPREFTWKASFFDYFRAVQLDLIYRMPSRNIFYCTQDIARESMSATQGEMDSKIVIPLCVDDETGIYSNYSSNRIVSVGRLVGFKSYNENIIKILDKLNDSLVGRPPFEYHIYGSGPNEKHLKYLASKIRSKVIFNGEVKYDNMKSVIKDSFIYIGTGSTLMESAILGVPTIIGIDSIKTPDTYGFYHEVEGTNNGEVDPSLNVKPILDVILGIIKNKSDYDLAAIHGKERACHFSVSSVSKIWHDSLLHSESINIGEYHYSGRRYFVSSFLWNASNMTRLLKDRKERY
ncbi:glycosyltransferase family 4 protein [Vibrio sp. 10N.286.52.C3]|uniref:glycosyltransferase family 4 protein n=1 Tax=Vibrio sp. 10N.286.52.C3 TaxID=3229713 RepID=UPI00355043B4